MGASDLGALDTGTSAEPLRLLDAVAATPVALAVTRGPDHTVTFVNAAWTGFLGPLEVGSPALSVLPEPARPVLRTALTRAFERSHQVVVRIPVTGGEVFELVLTPVLTASDQPYGLLLTALPPAPAGAASDQLAQRRQGALLSEAATVRWTWGPDDNPTQPCVGWFELTGQGAEAAAGLGWLAAVHPEDREQVRASWQAARAADQPWQTVARVRRTDGADVVLRALAVPLRDADGTLAEWAGAAFPAGVEPTLVPTLPVLADVDTAVTVIPGSAGPAGVFSDVVDQGTGHVVLVVGEVRGAAAQSLAAARMQSVVRSAIQLGLAPGAVLQVARDALDPLAPAAEVALLVAAFDAAGRVLTVVNAGMPAGVAVRADASVVLVGDEVAAPMGPGRTTPAPHHYGLPPGATLALATPSLVAALGVRGLAAALSGAAEQGLAELADQLALLATDQGMAGEALLVTLRAHDEARSPGWQLQQDLPAERPADHAAQLVATALAPDAAGADGDGWKALAVRAAGELVAVAAARAGRPPLRLRLRVLPTEVHLEVADTAAHDPAADPGPPLPAALARRSGVRSGPGGRVSWAEIGRDTDTRR